MNKTFMILWHEIYMLVRRFSFWFSVLGIPLIGFVVYGGAALINQKVTGSSDTDSAPLAEVKRIFTPQQDPRPQGYVDAGKLIRIYPDNFSSKELIAYPDQSAAQAALQAGEISNFFVIPTDYVQSGRLFAYMPEYNVMNASGRSQKLVSLINYNLLGGDQALMQAVTTPIQRIDEVNLSPQTSASTRANNSTLAVFLGYAIMLLFFVSIMGAASLLLNSLTNEKENRVIEILMVSANPQQLLMGKFAGLGLVGLFQLLLWASSGLVLLRLSGQSFNLPPEFLMSPSFIAWGVIFFMLGYLVYAALMAGIGALVPNLREASQVTTVVMLPLMAPTFLLPVFINMPNSGLAVALSLFPFTAPTMMMLRLYLGDVPLWQILLSVALLGGTGLLVIRLVARLFQAQTIMSGQPFRIKMFLKAMGGRGMNI